MIDNGRAACGFAGVSPHPAILTNKIALGTITPECLIRLDRAAEFGIPTTRTWRKLDFQCPAPNPAVGLRDQVAK